jgi:hypothetical protein
VRVGQPFCVVSVRLIYRCSNPLWHCQRMISTIIITLSTRRLDIMVRYALILFSHIGKALRMFSFLEHYESPPLNYFEAASSPDDNRMWPGLPGNPRSQYFPSIVLDSSDSLCSSDDWQCELAFRFRALSSPMSLIYIYRCFGRCGQQTYLPDA